MKKYFTLTSCMIILCWIQLSAQQNAVFDYINPKPASGLVSTETNLIFRAPARLSEASLSELSVEVKGSLSGVHSGELILAKDGRTLIFTPEAAFSGNESVEVILPGGLRLQDGKEIPRFQYNFSTAPKDFYRTPLSSDYDYAGLKTEFKSLSQSSAEIDYSLPPPAITIDSINDPSPGNIFLATWDRNVPAKFGNFIFVLDKAGAIVDSVRVKGAPFDFQVQKNGLLSYALGDYSINVPLPGEQLQHMVLDENLAVIDSFKMKNGYMTDFHEFILLPNGHGVMMSYHNTTYDLSKIVPGGRPDASLVINIIQEQDRNKNVVWEWRNIDYIPIEESDTDLTAARSNYSTLNAFDIDTDGNILASFRNHSEIMKISRATGEIMWRMGSPRGEFTYEGENEANAPYYHARQHNIRRLPNGNISMFDNGEYHKPPYSRAVEYSIDEVNKTASLVEEWIYPGETIFCVTAGNALRLSNGGWFIGYGVPNPQFLHRNMVEVHPDGSVALEISLPRGILAYRAVKMPWKETVDRVSYTNFEVQQGNTYTYNNENIQTGVDIEYTSLEAADYNESIITRVPYGPQYPEFIENLVTVYPVSIEYEGLAISTQSADVHIDLSLYPEIMDPAHVLAYYRITPGEGLFVPRPTSYDSVENEIVFTLSGFGEIVFLVPDTLAQNNAPVLYEPLDAQKLLSGASPTLRWTGKGSYQSFNVQVSTDPAFAEMVSEGNTYESEFPLSALSNQTTYYWRVNSLLEGEVSDWSETWSFELTDSYISILSPDGGEILELGDTVMIRWETNISDSVRVDLLENEILYLSFDTVRGSQQALTWEIADNFQVSDQYKVQVTSIKDEEISGSSSTTFTLLDSTIIGIGEHASLSPAYSLDQNYPNPFSESTRISYFTDKPGRIQLNVYNMLGQKVKTLVDEFQEYGRHSADFEAGSLPTGSYFYRLEAGEGNALIRKMVLIK